MKIKSFLSIFLITLMLLSLMPSNLALAAGVVSKPTVGDGTAESPYEITSADELYWFAGLINGTLTDGTSRNTEAHAILKNDITLNESVLDDNGNLTSNSASLEQWTSIGTVQYKYNGIFNGGGHTVSGVYINITSDNERIGFFGSTDTGAVITNLNIDDSYVKSAGIDIGGLVGNNWGTIKNCSANANVNAKSRAGCLVGHNYEGTIENSHSSGTATTTGDYAGGLVGFTTGTIKYCYTSAKVSGSEYVGGFAGISYANIEAGYCVSTVHGSQHAGGFAGEAWGTITNCYYAENSNAQGTEFSCFKGTKLPADAFTAGEAAYKLNMGLSVPVFGQIIGTDLHPVFYNGSNTVYVTSGCMTYNNNNDTSAKEHSFENGICKVCRTYENSEPQKVNDIYQISNDKELYWFAYHVNEGNTTANAALTADITLNEGVIAADGTLSDDTSGFKSWLIIGDNANSYSGTFDGNGHTLSGAYFNDISKSNVGIFGNCDTATVKNLGVANSYFKGNEYVGGICGYHSEQEIINCKASGDISGYAYIGGIAGYADYVNITNSSSSASVNGESGDIGGICGNTYSSIITDCSTSGTVGSENELYSVGGIVGSSEESNIEACTNNAAVAGKERIGGIVGDAEISNIKICTNNASVTGEEDTGGICGKGDETTINNCLNIGGILGYDYDYSVLKNCVNVGTVSAAKNRKVGGICGNGAYEEYNCYYLNTCEAEDTEFDCSDGSSCNADTLASGYIAAELQSNQEENDEGVIPMVWGQTVIGKDTDAYPILGGVTVHYDYEYDICTNYTELLNSEADGKKTKATVLIADTGNYTVVFADYENNALVNAEYVNVTVTDDNLGRMKITSTKDITLGEYDKIFLLDNMNDITPICEAYIVQ